MDVYNHLAQNPGNQSLQAELMSSQLHCQQLNPERYLRAFMPPAVQKHRASVQEALSEEQAQRAVRQRRHTRLDGQQQQQSQTNRPSEPPAADAAGPGNGDEAMGGLTSEDWEWEFDHSDGAQFLVKRLDMVQQNLENAESVQRLDVIVVKARKEKVKQFFEEGKKILEKLEQDNNALIGNTWPNGLSFVIRTKNETARDKVLSATKTAFNKSNLQTRVVPGVPSTKAMLEQPVKSAHWALKDMVKNKGGPEKIGCKSMWPMSWQRPHWCVKESKMSGSPVFIAGCRSGYKLLIYVKKQITLHGVQLKGEEVVEKIRNSAENWRNWPFHTEFSIHDEVEDTTTRAPIL